LIFNDALYTSHELESMQIPYLIQMKLIDLVNFLLLAMAIVMIDPLENQLGVKSTSELKYREFFFWSLLTTYWALTIAWNRFEGLAPARTTSYRIVQYALLVILIVMSILTAKWPARSFTTLTRRCIPMLLLLYFGGYKLSVFIRYEATTTKSHAPGASAPGSLRRAAPSAL